MCLEVSSQFRPCVEAAHSSEVLRDNSGMRLRVERDACVCGYESLWVEIVLTRSQLMDDGQRTGARGGWIALFPNLQTVSHAYQKGGPWL